MAETDTLWTVRTHIYAHFARTARAPGVEDIARDLGLDRDRAADMLRQLDERHALFLDPATGLIRIANPFSAVPTPFQVDVSGRTYWANCAWDAFGIPAALGASQAVIRASCAYSQEPLEIRLSAGRVVDAGQVIHFLVPFGSWYDDMVFT